MLLTLTDKAKSTFKANTPGRLVAVDFDDRTLRVVQADPHRNLPKLRKLADVQAPDGLDVEDAQAVGLFIASSLKDLGLDGMRVVMDVPRSQAVLKTIELPKGASDRELPAMVRYQVERELPFPIAEAIVDFTVVDRHADAESDSQNRDAARYANEQTELNNEAADKDTIEVLVAAVRQSVVERYEQIANSAGIQLQSLGLRPYADIRCLEACIPAKHRQQNIVLVHVLAIEAEINVLVNGSLLLSRATPIKRKDENHEPLTQEQVTDLLAVQVIRSVQSAMTAQGSIAIDHLYIAGDSQEVQPLIESLQKRWKGNCQQLDPLATLKLKRAATEGKGSITSLGLAIAHASSGVVPFDFLDPKKPPVERDIQKIRRIAIAATAAVVLLASMVYGVMYRIACESELESLRTQYNKLEKESRPIAKLERKVQDLENWVDGGVNWLDHWANISSAFPPATDAYITTMKTVANDGLKFTVKARSTKIITDLSKRLSSAGYIVAFGTETSAVNEYGYMYSTSVQVRIQDSHDIDVGSLKLVPRLEDDGSETLIKYKRRPHTSSPPFGRPSSFSRPQSNTKVATTAKQAPATSSQTSSKSSAAQDNKNDSRSSNDKGKLSSKDKDRGQENDRSKSDDRRKSYDKKGKYRR